MSNAKAETSLPQGIRVTQPVQLEFFYFMRYSNSNPNTSAKSLKKALECIENLTEAAAEVAAIFHTYQVIVEETGIPADPQVIEECSQMFTSMNRMLLHQKADLQHVRMMKKSMAKSDRVLKNIKKKHAEKSNQAVAVA